MAGGSSLGNNSDSLDGVLRTVLFNGALAEWRRSRGPSLRMQKTFLFVALALVSALGFWKPALATAASRSRFLSPRPDARALRPALAGSFAACIIVAFAPIENVGLWWFGTFLAMLAVWAAVRSPLVRFAPKPSHASLARRALRFPLAATSLGALVGGALYFIIAWFEQEGSGPDLLLLGASIGAAGFLGAWEVHVGAGAASARRATLDARSPLDRSAT